MRNIFLIAGITFKDSIRKKALIGIFFFGLALFLANVIITGMFSWELGKVAVDVGLSVVALSGLMIIFFFSIHMVAQDLERKTIYMILSRPVTKPQYILGKFCGLAMIILVSTAILGACATLSVKLATLGAEAFIPRMFSWPIFFLGLIYLTLSLLLVLAIAFLCVSVTTHPFTAILLCLMIYFIGQNAETVLKVMTRSKMLDNNPVLLRTIQMTHWIFPNLAAFDLKTTAAYGLTVDAAYLVWVAIYGLAYLGICLVLSIAIFNRRELG